METNIVRIFDTTLRDGEQSPGASMNLEEKLEVANQLNRLGVDVIEAGFPAASIGDFDAVRAIAARIDGPAICGLSRASDGDIDRCWDAIRENAHPRIHTFLATSDVHLQYKLKKTRAEVLEMVKRAVSRAKGYTNDVEFSAEDSTRSDMDFLCEVVRAAIANGATTINLPDTVGYTTPREYFDLITTVRQRVPEIENVVISVHCHNDLGLAVANSLSACQAGARQIECTVNGIGERAGNASLEEVAMILRTRGDAYGLETAINTREIMRASRLVSDVTGSPVQPNKAIVGANAFAHEAGIHQHGVMAHRSTYEIMDPEDVGVTESRLVLGKHSGRHAFERRLKDLGFELERDALNRAFGRFKDLADRKKDIFDADLEAIVSDEVYTIREKWSLLHMSVFSSLEGYPTATIKMSYEGREVLETGTGVGAVDAVYKTIHKIVDMPFTLKDYMVHGVTGGTDALADVTVRLASDGQVFTGRGSSLDIVEASAKAYIQAVNKMCARFNAAANMVEEEITERV
ncbi:MAG TPA: 2-isopropylmalate synthase [Armatimonadota bacterium]|jgi:2-isopropylmalate synthase